MVDFDQIFIPPALLRPDFATQRLVLGQVVEAPVGFAQQFGVVTEAIVAGLLLVCRLAALQSLFECKRDLPVYLTLRTAAQATQEWERLYPQLTVEIERQLLANTANRSSGFTSGSLIVAPLLGYAHLLEGQIEQAVAWALRPDIPVGWGDHDLTGTVTTRLLRMGVAAAGAKPDEVLRETLAGAPKMIREHGELLDATALNIIPNHLFDGAVRCYERLLTRAVDGRKRESYAVAGSYAKVISAIRKLEGKMSDFDAYYRSLFDTYPRLSAFKDELRSAIEGPGYKRKR